MFIELEPGSDGAPVAKEDWTIPVESTSPDVNPDEILSTLDADTRDYLRLLISGAGKGLKGRASDLRDLFRRFEPTHRDLARLNGAVADAAREPAPARLLAEPAQRRAGAPRRRPRRARRLVLERARARSPPRTRTSPRRSRSCRRAAPDDRHARPRRGVRAGARPGDRAAAPGGARARPGQRGDRAVREGGHAAAGLRHPAVRARGAPAGARPARPPRPRSPPRRRT